MHPRRRARGIPSDDDQGGGTIDGGAGRIAVKPQAVVCVPLPYHLGVDDDPALGIGTSGISDPQLPSGGRRSAIRGDDVRRVQAFEGVGSQVSQHQLDGIFLCRHPEAFVLGQHLHIGEAGDSVAQDFVHRGLIQELLRRVAHPVRFDAQVDEGQPLGIDERNRPVRQHVLLESVRQADGLPNAHHLFIGRYCPGPPIDVRITLDHNHFQAQAAQQVGRGGTGWAVADHGHVVTRRSTDFSVIHCRSSPSPIRDCSVVITTVV